APAPEVPKVSDATTLNVIDNFVVAKWVKDGVVKPAPAPATTLPATTRAATQATTQPFDLPLADDATFVRRVFLDLIGMIPTSEEARNFISDQNPRKRENLVDALLGRDKEYAGNWVP